MKRIDIMPGEKFDRLTVIKEVEPHIYPDGKTRRKFLCKCDCGNEVEVMIDVEFGKQQREVTDPLKKEYCSIHNIPLEEIWFNENINERMNQIISTYLHVNSVPSTQETV